MYEEKYTYVCLGFGESLLCESSTYVLINNVNGKAKNSNFEPLVSKSRYTNDIQTNSFVYVTPS